MKLAPVQSRMAAVVAAVPNQAKRSLGQNFLVADHVIEKILKKVFEFKPTVIIEVGPGRGALTDGLILYRESIGTEQGGELLLLELDHDLALYWQQQRGQQVIEVDALRWSGWQQWTLRQAGSTAVLVSNLPYQIAASIVIERSIDDCTLTGMVLMFQKEVAIRIRAKPNTADYSLLSVIAQSFWEIEAVCEAGPRDFSPAPKVASRVLGFRSLQRRLRSPKAYLQLVKRSFQAPRKKLRPQLLAHYPENLIAAWFNEVELIENVRPAQVSVDSYLRLYEMLEEGDFFGKG